METSSQEERGSATPPEDEGAPSVASFRTLTEHDRTAIRAVIQSMERVKLAQGQLREDVKVIADKLGMKPAELNRIIRLAMQERERGNVLSHEKAMIEVAEQVVF
jgi:hypothetical protein